MHDGKRRFAFRLALALGFPDVDIMLDQMPAEMLSEWLAYYQLEPFGILAEDTISAHWKAIYVNSNRNKGTRAKKVTQFLTFKDGEGVRDASALFEAEEE